MCSFDSFTTRRLVRLFAGVLVLAATAAPRGLHAQAITDGSFELSTSSTTMGNPGLGWMQQTTPANTSFVYNNSFNHGTTTYGSQWLLISGGTDSQTVSGFTPGQSYGIQFVAADVEGGTIPAITLSLSGGVTATQTFTLTESYVYFTGGSLALVPCRLNFIPTSTTPITLTFSGGYPLAVDQVSVVPEPGTWALLLVGGGVLALAWQRRRPRRTTWKLRLWTGENTTVPA